MVHHNQPPPNVCQREVGGVFYVEEENGSCDAGDAWGRGLNSAVQPRAAVNLRPSHPRLRSDSG